MDSVLSPREIQTRIRSGASLDEVVAAAGLPADRVERFAAPVLAEREHVAAQARGSSVRRRGETSGHRTLRAVLADRLRARRVDVDTVAWDAYRMENGRWAISATYEMSVGAAGTPGAVEQHQAVFHYDLQGRFSVAANDQARWVLGESLPTAPGQEPTPDTEPTIDLSDDLAIVRAVQEDPVDAGSVAEAEVLASVQPIRTRSQRARPPRSGVEQSGTDQSGAKQAGPKHAGPGRSRAGRSGAGEAGHVTSAAGPAASPPVAAGQPADGPERAPAQQPVADAPGPVGKQAMPTSDQVAESALDTLYAMLDGYGEDSPRVYAGLTELASQPGPRAAADPVDAPHRSTAGPVEPVAVPEAVAGRGAGWEPAIVVRYPVEPGITEDDGGVEVPEGSDDPGRAEPPVAGEDREDEAEALIEEQELESAPDVSAAVPEPTPDAAGTPGETTDDPSEASEEPDAAPAEPEGAPAKPEGAPAEPEQPPAGPEGAPTEPEGAPTEPEGAPAEPGKWPGPPAGSDAVLTEPYQPELEPEQEPGSAPGIDGEPEPESRRKAAWPGATEAASDPAWDEETASDPATTLIPVPSRPAPAKVAARRKRASVPSWDEIMFGGPRKS